MCIHSIFVGPTCHHDAACSDDNSAGLSSSIGECCSEGSHGSFKDWDTCISCESIGKIEGGFITC